MPKYAYWFRELVDLEEEWAKNLNYGRLFVAGFPIPSGFIVTELAKVEIQKSICVDDLSKISPSSIPEAIRREIVDYYYRMNRGYDYGALSDTTRDLVDFGRELNMVLIRCGNRAYPNVRGTGEMLEAVLKCFAFGSGPVIIQQMVSPEKAGLIYTTKNGQVEIEATYGFASPIISGQVEPDAYTASKDGRVSNKRLGSKKFAMYTNKYNRTIEGLEVRKDASESYVLNDRELEVVCRLGIKLEEFLKVPQKATWAIEGRRVYLLLTEPYSEITNAGEFLVSETQKPIVFSSPAVQKPIELKEPVFKFEAPAKVPEQSFGGFSGDRFGADGFEDDKPKVPAWQDDTPKVEKPGDFDFSSTSFNFLDEPKPTPKVPEQPLYYDFDAPKAPSYLPERKKGIVISGISSARGISQSSATFALLPLDNLLSNSEIKPEQLAYDPQFVLNRVSRSLYELISLLGTKKVIVRLSDGRTGSGVLGARGARRLGAKEVDLEISAIAKVSERFPDLSLALPFVTSVDEIRRAKDLLSQKRLNVKLGVVVETPAAVSIVDKLADSASFILVDINHLAELMLAIDRNDVQASQFYDVAHESILNALSGVIKICKGKGVPVYVCGDAVSNVQIKKVLDEKNVDVVFESEQNSFNTPSASFDKGLSW